MTRLRLDEALLQNLSTDKVQEEFYDSQVRLGGSFGVRVGRGGKKAFFLIYSISGKRRRMTLGTYPVISVDEARDRAIDVLRDVQNGGDPKVRRSRVPQRFGDLATLFVTKHVRKRCSERTAIEYERIIRSELLPVLSNRRIAAIRESDILDLVEHISEVRQRPVMANRVRALLGKIFTFALDRSIVDRNPVLTVAPARVLGAQGRSLTDPEVTELWSVLSDEPRVIAGVYKIMLLTGQNPGAVLGMRWDAVQLDEWTILGRKGRTRRIPLNQPAIQVLRDLRERRGTAQLVFPSASGAPMRSLQTVHRRILSRLSSQRPWTPADLRRTAERGLRELKTRPDVLEAILGRSSQGARLARERIEYDYQPDVESALHAWGRKILELTGSGRAPTPGGKVIQLFR
ncbi:MAG: integrase arm-type DNA-binding domain-containing protein [Bdellovibrionota bacterium]